MCLSEEAPEAGKVKVWAHSASWNQNLAALQGFFCTTSKNGGIVALSVFALVTVPLWCDVQRLSGGGRRGRRWRRARGAAMTWLNDWTTWSIWMQRHVSWEKSDSSMTWVREECDVPFGLVSLILFYVHHRKAQQRKRKNEEEVLSAVVKVLRVVHWWWFEHCRRKEKRWSWSKRRHCKTHAYTHTHKRQMPNKHPVEWTWRQLESTQWIAEDRSIVQFMFNSFQVAVGLMASQLMGCLMRTACINLYQHFIIAISPGSTLSSCVHVVRPTGLCCLVSKIARGTDFFLRKPSFAVYICTWASTC